MTHAIVLLPGDGVGPEVTAAASHVSVHAPVRAWMVRAQRSLGLASPTGVVMEGRDIGTVVFPNAALKFFLDATVEARGDRRFAQQPEAESRDAVLNEMRDRDGRDRTRTQSPLVPAEDAVLLDTTSLTLQQVLEKTEALVRERLQSDSPD